MMAKEGAEVTERLAHVSEKTGIGIRDLQTLEAAGKTVGVSLEDMVMAFRKFDQAITGNGRHAGAAASVLKELGITARDNKEALLQAADAFKAMEDGPRKAADSVALFGKSGLNMIPFLNKGRQGILEFEEAVDTFGPKITKQGIANTEAWKVSVEKLSLSWQNLAVTISDNVLPALTKSTEAMAGLVRGASVLTGASLTGIGALLSGKNLTGALAGYLAERTAETGTDADEQALKRKNEAITLFKEHYKELFALEKAGGHAQLALTQAQEKITAAIQQEDFKAAARLEETLPSLKKAADLEAQRLAHAKQLAASYEAIQKLFVKGATKPLLKSPAIDASKGIEALFGPQTKNPLGGPDIGSKQFGDLNKFLAATASTFGTGKQALDGFYDEWNKRQQGTEHSINADFAKQLENWKDLLNKQAISQQQFNDVSNKLEKERQDGLKRLRQDTGTSTFRDAWQDMFKEIELSGKDFARSIAADISFAIQSLNQQLQQFVATGKGLSLKSIGQSLEANLFGSVLRKAESGLFGSLGNLFGLSGLGGKRDGSSANNALFVQFAGAGGAGGIGTLPLGNLGAIANLLGGSSSGGNSSGGILSSIGGIFGKIGGGLFGGIGSFLGSLFGGFRAEGGNVEVGKAYVVGEKRPELFIPRAAGTIVKSVSSSDTRNINVVNQLHVHGATDADSFRKSQTQIFNGMSRAQQRAMSRA
jgi:hypothetical protein